MLLGEKSHQWIPKQLTLNTDQPGKMCLLAHRWEEGDGGNQQFLTELEACSTGKGMHAWSKGHGLGVQRPYVGGIYY